MGGVGGEFPRNLYWSKKLTISTEIVRNKCSTLDTRINPFKCSTKLIPASSSMILSNTSFEDVGWWPVNSRCFLFLFQNRRARSTISKEKIEGLWTWQNRAVRPICWFRLSELAPKNLRSGWILLGTAMYGLYRYVPLLMVWFSSSLLWDRIYIVNQRVWV